MPDWTPGPWEECRGADGTGCVCGVVWSLPADAPVASCDTRAEDAPPTVPDLPHRQANARLVAAAPDLYEALDWLVFAVDEGSLGSDEELNHALTVANQALAKARGEDDA